MCGIAGFYLKGEPAPCTLLEGMADRIAHRGPDDWGFYGVGGLGTPRLWRNSGGNPGPIKVGMGFRRLSILDLSPNGAQPMQADGGRYTLTFNGQIYNYVELRRELRDVTFRSTSDTEVLLHALAQWGLDGLRRFDGMFAFAFYDATRDLMTIARDPLGIKPLYYFEDERGLFYASEIRALLPVMGRKPGLRRELVARYLMSNWIPEPDTLFEGVRKLEPGHFLIVGKDGVKKQRYWEMSFAPDDDVAPETWLDELGGALQTTVDRQLRSDVPVAFFLSGGIDSSLLVAKAIEARPGEDYRPSTFTIGFRWAKSKEFELDLQYARLLRQKFPLDYHEIILEPSIVSLLPRIVEVLEEPIADPAAICSYLICEAASKQFKVMISGQGGDELFGGYPVYQGGWMASQLQSMPRFVAAFFQATSQALPYAARGRELRSVHRLQKLFLSMRNPWPEPFFVLRSALRVSDLDDIISQDIADSQVPPFARHLEHFEQVRDADRFHQMMYLDTKTYLTSTNLAYSDKTSMAHSVELRVPLLGMELVRLAERLPSRFKATLGESKILLKQAAERSLPPQLITRRKAGFGLPIRDWFKKDLQPMAYDLLSESRLRQQGLFNPVIPSRWLREHREMTADHGMKLYSLMSFQLWLEKFGVSV